MGLGKRIGLGLLVAGAGLTVVLCMNGGFNLGSKQKPRSTYDFKDQNSREPMERRSKSNYTFQGEWEYLQDSSRLLGRLGPRSGIGIGLEVGTEDFEPMYEIPFNYDDSDYEDANGDGRIGEADFPRGSCPPEYKGK